jgi:transcriptional regulator with XRE-family HTH domain
MRRIKNAEAARACGYTQTWVSLVLNGHRPGSPEFRRKLATFLDLPEASLSTTTRPSSGVRRDRRGAGRLGQGVACRLR